MGRRSLLEEAPRLLHPRPPLIYRGATCGSGGLDPDDGAQVSPSPPISPLANLLLASLFHGPPLPRLSLTRPGPLPWSVPSRLGRTLPLPLPSRAAMPGSLLACSLPIAAPPLLSLDMVVTPPPLISFVGAIEGVARAPSPRSHHGTCGGMETEMGGRSTRPPGHNHHCSDHIWQRYVLPALFWDETERSCRSVHHRLPVALFFLVD